jgi:hypothetical protein
MAEQTQGTTEDANVEGEYERRTEKVPIVKNEDVEFSCELADADDLEAVDRAHAADQRQQTLL